MNSATELSKTIQVPKATISGTHTITATARVAGVAVQRKAATFKVVQQTASVITQSTIALTVTHGQRGDFIGVSGFNNWVFDEEPVEYSDDILLCPPGYENDAVLAGWIAQYGCPLFKGYKLELSGGKVATVDMDGSTHYALVTHVPDGWFDARERGERWPVENEVKWGATQVCLIGTLQRWYLDWEIVEVSEHVFESIQVKKSLGPEDHEIVCAPFTVDPPTPAFSAQYKLMAGNQYVPLSKNPKIIVDGRSVGARDATPPTVKQAYSASTANTPIDFTVPEGSYLVSAYACNYIPEQELFTRGRGDQGIETIQMEYTPFDGPAVESLQPGLQTYLYPTHPDRIGPLMSFEGVANPPEVSLPITIMFPDSNVAEIISPYISATINGIPPVSESNINGGRIATWNASLLPAGELTLRVQLYGRYKTGQGDCGNTYSWGPISQKTIVMAAAPPWTHSDHATVTELNYYPDQKIYHMAGVLNYGVSLGDGEGTDLGFLGKLKNYLIANTDVSQDFNILTGAWTAQAKVTGGVSLMCLTSLMGDCSEDYTLNLVAEPAGATINSASTPSSPDLYRASDDLRVYEYNIAPIEVYNGIIASYWGIVNVNLSINFGAGAALDIEPALQSDFTPQMTFIPQANINVPISLWVDILLGAASAGVDAVPSVTLSMPVTVDTGGAHMSGPDVCFRLTGRVWVEVLFWDASFGPFDLFQYGSCALQALLQAVTTTPPPSTLPAPALATDGYGHVLGAWVHNDSNSPTKNQGKLYTVYFDGANWGAQQLVAGGSSLVTDPAIAFAGENEAVAVFATNEVNVTQPLSWGDVRQQLVSQKISYSVYDGTTWSTPTALTLPGGGPHGRVTIAGDPDRGRAIAMWIHDMGIVEGIKRWVVMYSVYDAETNTWTVPILADDTPTGSLDAEVSLAFDSTGQATAVWVRQAGVQAGSAITTPFNLNEQRTLVTANWHPNDPYNWDVTAQPLGLPVGALMPDIAFDDNDQPVVAYALHQQDRDGETATGLGNNAYLGYAVGTRTSVGYGPQTTQPFVWTANIVPGVKGVEQPRVAMLPDDQALVTYRGFGQAGTLEYAGAQMASTIDLRHTGTFQASTATVVVNGNSWMNDAITTRTRPDGSGSLEPRLFTVGAFNLGGPPASARMSGAGLRQISLADADSVMLGQVPVLPDLSIAPADVILSETLPISGTQVPFTVTVRNLGVARNHQPVVVELIQDPDSPQETLIATGIVPIDLIFNGTYDLTGTWQADGGAHVWLARVKPPIDDDVNGDNNEATMLVGVPAIPDQLVGGANDHSRSAGLSWLPVTGAAMSHYRVYRATAAGEWELLAATSQTAFTDGTLDPDITYHYAVSAVSDADVESPLSEEVTLSVSGAKKVYLPLIQR